jgi:hypothetical protein
MEDMAANDTRDLYVTKASVTNHMTLFGISQPLSFTGILHLLLLLKASRIYSLECATHLRQLSALAQRRPQILSLISCHGQVSGRVCYPGLGSVSGHLCVQGCPPSRTRLSDDFDLCYFAMSYAAS